MSTYNVREKFSYTIATSSVEYIRNYNFNSTTVTNIPLSMANSDTEVPITVNITTTVPWIQVVDPTSGADLKYPNGNVVLGPTSSSTVFVKIDLPADIENVPESVLYPNISLDIKSGSFKIVSTGSSNTSNTNTGSSARNVDTEETGSRVDGNQGNEMGSGTTGTGGGNISDTNFL